MFLRRTILIAAAVFLMNASVHAYDTQGKFGMGISLMGTPVLLFSPIKIGITNTLGFEPSVGYNRFSVKNAYTSDRYVDVTETHKTSYNLLMLSGMFDIRAIQRARSNFLLRVGCFYWLTSISDRKVLGQSENIYESEDETWNLSFKAGFGVEHFFSDHFSVYAGAISLFGTFGADDVRADYSSFLSLASVSSQMAELSFIWYL